MGCGRLMSERLCLRPLDPSTIPSRLVYSFRMKMNRDGENLLRLFQDYH